MIIKTSYPFMKPPPSARLIRGHRLAQGVVGFWPENERGGFIVHDLSENSETGIIDATGLWVPGKFGSCVKFDGADTLIALGTNLSGIIGIPGADFAFSAWVNVSGFPENNIGWLFGFHSGNVTYLRWRRDGNGEHFDCFVDYDTSDAFTESSDIGDASVTDVWTHVVAVLNDATKTVSLFINGVEESNYLSQTSGVGARVDRSGLDVTIGNDNTAATTFNGLIDLPTFWNRALSASEISQLYYKPFCMFERKARTALFIPSAVAIPGWVGINSSHYDSHCGDDGAHTVEEALDGTDYWGHVPAEVHWLILDLGSTYNVQKVRGRSSLANDPTDVNIYVSDDKENWGGAVVSGINTWQDFDDWVEVNVTNKNGRYIKIEIEATEGGAPSIINWGNDPAYTIFDVYIDEAVVGNVGIMTTNAGIWGPTY